MRSILNRAEEWEMELLALGLAILVLGLMFPYHLPLFGGYTILLFVYAVLNKRVRKPSKAWVPFVVVVLFFLWGFYNSQIRHPLVERDLRNLITISIFGLLMHSMLENRQNFERFQNALIRMLTVVSTLVACIGLIKFFGALKGVEFEFFRVHDGLYPWGSSLINDTNVYSLGGVIGLTAYAYAVSVKDIYIIRSKLHFVIGPIMIANILLAGSRRGIALLALIISIVVIVWIYKKVKGVMSGSKKSVVILIVSIASILIIVNTVKVKHVLWIIKPAVEVVGLDFRQFKEESTIITYRYMTIVDDDLRIDDYYRSLWNEESTIDMSQIRSLNSKGVKSRVVRWNLAMDIYEKHSDYQKYLGSGFDYMQAYEARFSYMHQSSDYPHNHFLSALLFSGLIGLTAFIMFILQIVVLSVKYLRHATFITAILFLVFSFYLISANTFFSGKLLTVLCLLPLVYGKIFRKTT